MPARATAPINPLSLALIILGVHLAFFFALIRLAWVWNDIAGAASIAAVTLILSGSAFLRIRGKSGADIAMASKAHLGICCAAMLTTLNLRIDVWVAAAYGVTVAEAHRILPIWIVPALSLAFILWAGVMPKVIKQIRPVARS